MKKKRKPRKRIGISAALLLIAFLPSGATAKKKPALDDYAIVSGSVSTESGYALSDADVTLAPESQSGSSSEKPAGKAKPLDAVSDARGEFVFHVPPGPLEYVVTVAAKGYRTQRKKVSVQDRERIEVTFQLEPESK
jgi:Carboxypeptidase regulatory-like domain